MKKGLVVAAILIFSVLCILLTKRIYDVNKGRGKGAASDMEAADDDNASDITAATYTDATSTDGSASINFKFNGTEYCISDIRVWEFKQFVYEHPERNWLGSDAHEVVMEGEKGEDIDRILTYRLTYTIGSREEITNPDIPFEPEQHMSLDGAWITVPEYDMYWALNIDVINEMPEFGKTYEKIIPIVLNKESFSDRDWEKLEGEDTGIKVLFAYQPKEFSVKLSDSMYMSNTEEAELYFADLYDRAKKMLEAQITPDMALDENVSETGHAEYFGQFAIDIEGVDELSVDEVYSNPAIAPTDERNELREKSRFFKVDFKLTNVSDKDVNINLANMDLVAVKGTDMVARADFCAMDARLFEGFAAYMVVIAPGDTFESFAVFFNPLTKAHTKEEFDSLWNESELYFVFNPNGQSYQSLNNKNILFIKPKSINIKKAE